MKTYRPLPVSFARGIGAWLEDNTGKRYLDAISGIAVCSLGHANPEIAEALADQAATLIHTSNLYQIGLQQQLGNRLTQIAGMDRVFFGNSGAEANEAAIKLARLYGHGKGIANPTIIVTENSFHGRTMATLSATGNPKIQTGFEPLVSGFSRVPYNDVAAIEARIAEDKNIVAVLVEPVQGEGGVNIPGNDYLKTIRELCDKNDLLMMLDEIQTGICRTGRWFGFEHENAQSDCRPDVMTLAKSLGNGVPIGACLARGKAAEVMQPGTHGSTYGGNPLACRAAITVLDIMERDNMAARAAALGESLLADFNSALSGIEGVSNIRGKGLMIGIELDRPCADLVGIALEQGLLINVTADKVIRLLPPIIMTDDEARQLVDTLSALIKNFLG